MTFSADDRAAAALPESVRIARWPLTMMWWASCSAIAYLFLSVQLALKYGTVNTLIGMTVASLVMGTVGGILAPYSLRTGASSSVLSQIMFGTRGAAVPTLILCITCLYYSVFEGAIVATATIKVWPALSYGAAVLIVVVYSTPLSVGTVQNFLNKLNAVLLPFYLLGLIMLTWLTIRHYGYSNAWLHMGPTDRPTLIGCWNCFVPYFGTLALAMETMDIARFGRASNERYHAIFNFGVPFYFLTYLPAGAVGIFIVGTTSPTAEISDTAVLDACLLVLGGVAGILWVTVTQTRINSANFYVTTVNLQAFFEEAFHLRLPKAVCAAAVGLAVFFFMRASNVLGSILVAVHYLGIFLVAWAGVALAQVLSTRKVALADIEPLPDFKWAGLLSWIIGVFVGVGLDFIGGVWESIAAPATVLVSALLYRAACARDLLAPVTESEP